MAKFSRLFFARGSGPPDASAPGGNLVATLKADVPAVENGFGGGLARLLSRAAPAASMAGPAVGVARADLPVGRLAFVIDATASRAAAWNEAKTIQRRMVRDTQRFGRLALRVVHFRGGGVGPRASLQAYPAAWTEQPEAITKHMDEISCASGNTQILAAMDLVLRLQAGGDGGCGDRRRLRGKPGERASRRARVCGAADSRVCLPRRRRSRRPVRLSRARPGIGRRLRAFRRKARFELADGRRGRLRCGRGHCACLRSPARRDTSDRRRSSSPSN